LSINELSDPGDEWFRLKQTLNKLIFESFFQSKPSVHFFGQIIDSSALTQYEKRNAYSKSRRFRVSVLCGV
jgi:hypothetical protein